MSPEELPDEWQTNLDTQMHCPVVDKEYENPEKAWGKSIIQYALTGRYEYEFGAVSLGTGFTVKVRDSATDDSIDITDYDDW
ncbi:MAG: hypothetical protein H6669_01450 [Ardenticatenaceae bacterium]|nr:hypothetical protein [Ardenticatenaceae bacterium]